MKAFIILVMAVAMISCSNLPRPSYARNEVMTVVYLDRGMWVWYGSNPIPKSEETNPKFGTWVWYGPRPLPPYPVPSDYGVIE